MTVLLNQPLPFQGTGEPSEAIGYIIVIGINAPDLAAAVKFAHDVALRPKKTDGTFRSFDGVVVEAKVRRVEKTHWGPEILRNAKRIDQEGAYYSTGLIFFPAGSEGDGERALTP